MSVAELHMPVIGDAGLERSDLEFPLRGLTVKLVRIVHRPEENQVRQWIIVRINRVPLEQRVLVLNERAVGRTRVARGSRSLIGAVGSLERRRRTGCLE